MHRLTFSRDRKDKKKEKWKIRRTDASSKRKASAIVSVGAPSLRTDWLLKKQRSPLAFYFLWFREKQLRRQRRGGRTKGKNKRNQHKVTVQQRNQEERFKHDSS